MILLTNIKKYQAHKYGFKNLINKATRVTENNTFSCIDHILYRSIKLLNKQ